jgi:hypothetical protein
VFGLRRLASPRAELQVRVNGSVVGTKDIPADANGSASVPLLFGGLGTCGAFDGMMAAAVVVEGPFSDQQTCELERFLLARLHAAGLAEPAAALACTP